MNVIIETERLLLRPFKQEDVDDVLEGLNDLEVSKWLAFIPYPFTKEDAINYVNNAINSKDYNFAIVLKKENKVIGATQIRGIDRSQGIAHGGIWLNNKYQGKGYGTEAFGARIKYAFEDLKLRRLENGYFKGNEKSHKMQLKFGYKDEGIKRQRYLCLSTGETVDECITGLLKDEWIMSK